MSADPRVDRAVQTAVAKGWLAMPESTLDPRADDADARPWPVVLLTGLGAWLVAVPLLGAIALLFQPWTMRGAGLYAVGGLLLGASLVVLHSRAVPLFVEQLAVPGLLVGGGALGFGLTRDLPDGAAFALLAVVCVGVAAVVRASWLRRLLGAAAASLTALALAEGGASLAWASAWHAVAALWVIVQAGAARPRAATALVIEPLADGWLVATLSGLAVWAGLTFGVGALIGDARDAATSVRGHGGAGLWRIVSVLLTLAGAIVATRRWPGVRRAWLYGVGAGLAMLAAFMPTLGATLLLLVLSATSGRPRLSAAAALAAAWIVGAFYYQLAWPLADKALLLVGVATLLAGLARAGAGRAPIGRRRDAPSDDARRRGLVLAGLATLAVVNLGIWRKETLIASGEPVFIRLAPVDPRSLMQGDFMRLAFDVPAVARALPASAAARPAVVGTRDPRGVLTLQRLADARPLEPDERRVELTPKNGRWTVVTDAWFFAEGEASRWQPARYGEFRLDASGRALLIGLRGPDLAPL